MHVAKAFTLIIISVITSKLENRDYLRTLINTLLWLLFSLFFNHFLGHSIRISGCKIFVNFAKKKKNLLFLFYIPIFTKQPHQFVYSTHLFNKIFIFTHHQRSIYTHPTTTINPPSYHHQALTSATIISHHHQSTIINHHHPKTHWSNKELKRSKPQNPLIKQKIQN